MSDAVEMDAAAACPRRELHLGADEGGDRLVRKPRAGADDEATWDMAASLGLSRQLTTGAVLDELVQQGHDIVVCTADLGRPTQVIGFGRKYPDRYFNFGIAERNMIGAAAGLATTGHVPVISNYSFFLALMGVENIRNDICYPGLNVG